MKYQLTGNVLKGNYTNAPHISGELVDAPIQGKRVTVMLDGMQYERTLHHRVKWTQGPTARKTVAEFVIINGDMLEVQPGTKTCPRCGEELFADMDVCYGCLYDFWREQQ